MIIGSSKNKMEVLVHDMKSHISTIFRNATSNNMQESRNTGTREVYIPKLLLANPLSLSPTFQHYSNGFKSSDITTKQKKY